MNQTLIWSHTLLNIHLSVSREKKYTLKFLFPTFRSSSSAAIWAAESLLRCGGRELEELLLIRSHTLFISSLICQFVSLTKEMKEKYLKKSLKKQRKYQKEPKKTRTNIEKSDSIRMSPSLYLSLLFLFTLQELLLFSTFRRYPFYLSSQLQIYYLHLLLIFLQIYIRYIVLFFDTYRFVSSNWVRSNYYAVDVHLERL